MTENLSIFLAAGVLFGAVYDVLRFFRLIFPNKKAVFIFDILFFFIISPVMFLLLLSYNNGQVRVFYFTAAFFGFIAYILTIYRLTGVFERGIASFIRKIMKKCLKSFKKVLQKVKKVYYNSTELSRRALHSKKKSKTKKSKKKEVETDGEDFSEFKTE